MIKTNKAGLTIYFQNNISVSLTYISPPVVSETENSLADKLYLERFPGMYGCSSVNVVITHSGNNITNKFSKDVKDIIHITSSEELSSLLYLVSNIKLGTLK